MILLKSSINTQRLLKGTCIALLTALMKLQHASLMIMGLYQWHIMVNRRQLYQI